MHHLIHAALYVIGVFAGLGIVLGWFAHMIFHRIRHGKNAHQ